MVSRRSLREFVVWVTLLQHAAVLQALEMLFSGPGYSQTYRNTWMGWYSAGGYIMDSAGVMLSGRDGKTPAYDTAGLVGVRFEDTAGGFIEFQLFEKFRGRSLLSIVNECMGGDRENDGSTAWRSGHCKVGKAASTFGIAGASQEMVIGYAGSHVEPLNWVLFKVQESSAGRGLPFAYGTQNSTNPGFAGRVYIYGVQYAVEQAGIWKSVTRPCQLDEDGCVTSHNFPKFYGAQEHCSIEIEKSLAGPLNVTDFDTENNHDFLTVNGKAYSGSAGPQGIVPVESIVWRSDNSVSKRGWRLCPPPITRKKTDASADSPSGFRVFLPVILLAMISLICYFGPTMRQSWRRWHAHRLRFRNDVDEEGVCGDFAVDAMEMSVDQAQQAQPSLVTAVDDDATATLKDEKSGGTAFMQWLKYSVWKLGKLESSFMYTMPGHPVAVGSPFYLKTAGPEARARFEVVSGHFDWRVMHEGVDCPSRKKVRCFLLVRDPIDRFLSYYRERTDGRYARGLGRGPSGWSAPAWRRYLRSVERDRLWYDGKETGVFCNRENMLCVDLEKTGDSHPLAHRVRPKAAKEMFYFRFLGGPQKDSSIKRHQSIWARKWNRLAWALDPEHGKARTAIWRLRRCVVGLQMEDPKGFREVLGHHFPWLHELKVLRMA
eukprot:s4410_g3.t2